MTPLEQLKTRINRNGDINDPATVRPLVSLEEFFEGNDDAGSIGYNLPDPPKPSEFYTLFKEIRNRKNVSDVLVEVLDQSMPDEWPSAETVWIISSAPADVVSTWLPEEFAADDVWDGWTDHIKREPYDVPPGMKAIGLWWD